jgi:hypothetical protein
LRQRGFQFTASLNSFDTSLAKEPKVSLECRQSWPPKPANDLLLRKSYETANVVGIKMAQDNQIDSSNSFLIEAIK